MAPDGKLPFSLGFKGLEFKGQGSRVWGLGYKGSGFESLGFKGLGSTLNKRKDSPLTILVRVFL